MNKSIDEMKHKIKEKMSALSAGKRLHNSQAPIKPPARCFKDGQKPTLNVEVAMPYDQIQSRSCKSRACDSSHGQYHNHDHNSTRNINQNHKRNHNHQSANTGTNSSFEQGVSIRINDIGISNRRRLPSQGPKHEGHTKR